MVVIPSNRPHPQSVTPSRAKSVLDRSVAALLLLLSGVCLVAVALAMWLEDDGPLLTRERRIGRDGREFDLLRFRTSAWARPAPGAPVGGPAAAVDRCSSVGGVLRRYHLDELPVLVNVVKGDLSLVGPRPRPAAGPPGASPPGVRPGLLRPWRADAAPRSSAEEARAVQDYLRGWSPADDLAVVWNALREQVLPPRP